MKQDCTLNCLPLLLALIEAKYIHVSEIRNLSTILNGHELTPQYWLTELSVCDSIDEAQDILRKQVHEKHMVFDKHYLSFLCGFLYLGVQEGKISLSEFQAEFVDVIDAYNDFMGITIEDLQDEFLSMNQLPGQDSLLGRCLIDAAEKSKSSFGELIAFTN
ncbi:hypothetical protein ACO0LF_18735 [Undibacterium sp. Di27W]|uniref:hypothetical protein n=1 Tax=Undibacterium sp. Di27W TaxID=3413036 RepID=UPI003BEF7E16